MMKEKFIEITSGPGVSTIVLNRPEVRNAINPEMINELIAALNSFSEDPEISILVIRGKGGNFSAGADLNWMRKSGSNNQEQNLTDSRLISNLMKTLDHYPAPVISVTEGAVFGGAIGILGCSDWVFSSVNSVFGFSEVRLGLAPAIILPYVQQRSQSIKIKQFMLTGQSFSAAEALSAGLSDQLTEPDEMQEELNKLINILTNLPAGALREIKRLWRVSRTAMSDVNSEIYVNSISALKQSNEAQELLTKFLNKTK